MIPIEELPDKELLAKADTAPRMFLFVPSDLAIMFATAFFAINTLFHAITYGCVVFPFWMLAAVLTKRDVNGVRMFMVKWRLWLMLFDSYRWEGFSASPWPLNVKRKTDHAL